MGARRQRDKTLAEEAGAGLNLGEEEALDELGISSRGYSLSHLLELGRRLDERPTGRDARTVAERLSAKLLKVRDRGGRETPLQPNRAQREFEATRGRQNIVLKARQMGMTTWVAGRFFLKTITARGVLTVQVAHTREAAEAIFRIVQRFWQALPEEMRKGPLRRSRANVGQMVFSELDSEFRVLSAADPNAGRGLTMQNLHCSEVARWPGDAAATLAGLRGALAPGGELVMESTPNGAHGCFYEEWLQADERDVVRHFYPWWLEESYVSAPASGLLEEELALVRTHGLSAAQIGFRRGLQARYRGLRMQEFAENADLCFRASGECCFDLDSIEARLREAALPFDSRRAGLLQIWMPPTAGKEYLIGVDSAGGGSDGDYAAVQVIELASGMQCAELRQHLGALELAHAAAELGREYGMARIAVERNNHGATVLAYLEAVEHYPHVVEQAGLAGWLTTASSKPPMIARLGALLVESPTIFRSRRLLEECRTFVSHPGGRTGAAGGAHDDCLMAFAVAQAVRAQHVETPGRQNHRG